MLLSMSLQAKDSDDDDEVTVSVDRDRFMDEFFEQVRGFVSPLQLSSQFRAFCWCWSRLRLVVWAPTMAREQRLRWGWGCPG